MEAPKRKPVRKPTKPVNTLKKENMAELIRRKKECEKKAHEIVLKLIESPVEKEYLIDNALNISKHHMEDVIEERKLAQLCGWVLCDNKIDPQSQPKQTYSIRGHKVLDITERKAFCNGKCYAKARHFKAQLLTSPLWLRDMEEDVQCIILEDDETKELHGISVALTSVKLDDDSEPEEGEEAQVQSSDKSDKTESNEEHGEEDEES
jgi:hypothetical protein